MDGLTPSSSEEVVELMHKIQERSSVFEFLGCVIIALMTVTGSPQAYETDENVSSRGAIHPGRCYVYSGHGTNLAPESGNQVLSIRSNVAKNTGMSCITGQAIRR
ncbi:hypothetical protein LIER_32527 [Lithospermum erythrorhizon]|uniref:Uncharacterized protein n=1 Tax=Lithospermum erythrorhizon TaxID=34254 RepID=A0AAV3RXR1_LITER